MKTEQIPFKLSHYGAIRLDEHLRKNVDPGELLHNGFTYTLIIDNQIIAIWGEIWKENVLQVFIIPDAENFQKYRFSVWLIAQSYLRGYRELLKEGKLKRIWTFSRATKEVDSWMNRLRFVVEGTHPHFTPDGETYRSWRLV